MSELSELFSIEFRTHWEWLAGSSIKVTAWLLLVLAILQFLHKASASWRHLIAVCGAIGIPLIFLLNFSPIPDQLGWHPFVGTMAEPYVVKAANTTSVEAEYSLFRVPVSLEVRDEPAQDSPGTFDFLAGIVAFWWLGAFIVGGRLLLRLRGPRLSLLSEAPVELRKVLERECAGKNIRTTPALRIAPNAMPMAHGMRREGIILPAEAIDWPPGKLASVLRHELTHIQRRDVCWAMIVEAALVPVWWHPLARILRRRIFEWTEQACDDAVIISGIVPTQYATDLLSLSCRNAMVPAAGHGLAALSGQKQKLRFGRLLDETASRTAVSSGKALAVGLLALGGVVPATLLVSCSKTKEEAKVEKPVLAPSEIPEVPNDAGQIVLEVKFFETEFPSGKDLEHPGVASWLAGETKLLSPKRGEALFSPMVAGTDLLSAPRVFMLPGHTGKVEIVREVPLSNQENPDLAMVGVVFDARVWPTVAPDTLKVDLAGSVTEVTGHKPDETGFPVPQLRRLGNKFQGAFPNGSYLYIGELTNQVIIEDKVPLLGDIPVLSGLFSSRVVRDEKRIIAAQVIISEAPQAENGGKPTGAQ